MRRSERERLLREAHSGKGSKTVRDRYREAIEKSSKGKGKGKIVEDVWRASATNKASLIRAAIASSDSEGKVNLNEFVERMLGKKPGSIVEVKKMTVRKGVRSTQGKRRPRHR